MLILCSTSHAVSEQQKVEQIEQNKEYSSDSGYGVAQSYGNANDDIQTAAQYPQSSYAGSAPYQPQQPAMYSYNPQPIAQQQQPNHFIVSLKWRDLLERVRSTSARARNHRSWSSF